MGRSAHSCVLLGAVTVLAARAAPNARPPNATALFLARWAGDWRGTLEIYAGVEVRQRVSARRVIGATADADGYVWCTAFDDDTTWGLKDYRLRVVTESSPSRYAQTR